MDEQVVLKFSISRTKRFILGISYVLRTSLPFLFFSNVFIALLGGCLISFCDIPFGIAFVIALILFTTGNLAAFVGSAWLKARKKWDYIQEDCAYTIDFVQKRFKVSTAGVTVESSFRRVKRCRKFLGYVVLDCSPVEFYFLPRNAFSSMEAVEYLISFVRESIRMSGANRIQVIAPSVIPLEKRTTRWKKVWLIIGVSCIVLGIFMIFAGRVGHDVYRIYNPPEVELSDMRLQVEELTELSAAFARLSKALQDNAPGLMARRRPLMNPEMFKRLQSSLQGKNIEALVMWYIFFDGLDDCELIPGGKLAGIDFAINTRKRSDDALVRYSASHREQSMILLHDGAGDGYFFGITPEYYFVYWDELKEPGIDIPMGTLASFVNTIADSIEKRLWTYDANGKLQATDTAAAMFMMKAMQNGVAQPLVK